MCSTAFLAGNLIVIPLLFVILPLAAITALIAPISYFIAHICGKVLGFLLAVIDHSLAWLTQLPWTYFWPVYWDELQVSFVYVAIIGLVIGLYSRYSFISWAMIGLGIALATLQWHYEFRRAHNSSEWVVWNVRYGSVSGYRRGAQLYANKHWINDPMAMDYAEHFLIQRRLYQANRAMRPRQSRYLFGGLIELCVVHGTKILILHGDLKPLWASHPLLRTMVCDYLILANGSASNGDFVLRSFSAKQIIIDSSHSARVAEYFVRICDTSNVSCYNVGQKGAWIQPLNRHNHYEYH